MGWISNVRARRAREAAHYWARTNGAWPTGNACTCLGCTDAADAIAISWWCE